MSSMYGKNIKISIFSQSHSEALGVSVDGFEVEDWSSDNPLIIKNVTQIVFKSYTNTNIDTFTSNAIYSYGGTAMSNSNVPTYVNRILYLQKDFTISYKV